MKIVQLNKIIIISLFLLPFNSSCTGRKSLKKYINLAAPYVASSLIGVAAYSSGSYLVKNSIKGSCEKELYSGLLLMGVSISSIIYLQKRANLANMSDFSRK